MPVPYKIEKSYKESFLQQLENTLHHFHFPPQIIIESTAACNLTCIHCSHVKMNRRKGNMREELWKKLIDEIADRAPHTEVWPTFYGEALILRRRITDWIGYARKKGLTNLVLNSNGMLLTEDMMHALIDSGLHQFIISLDGFTKETFEKIRRGAIHEKVYGSVLRLLEIVKERKAHHMKVEVQFSMMDENEHELSRFKKFWLERGAHVKTREKLTWTGTQEAPNLDSQMNRIACPWAVRTCAIHWNGDLVACAVDYDGGFVAGNVRQDTIHRIWNTTHKDFVEKHLKHYFKELPDLCQRCLDWQVGGGAAHETPRLSDLGN